VLANAGVDFALHTTYYVAAFPLRLVARRGCFGLFAGFLLLDRQDVGAPDNETFGKIHFWTTFIGVNLTFFRSIPRTGRHAATDRGVSDAFAGWNFVSSIGAFISYARRCSSSSSFFHTFAFGRRVGPITGARARPRSNGRSLAATLSKLRRSPCDRAGDA